MNVYLEKLAADKAPKYKSELGGSLKAVAGTAAVVGAGLAGTALAIKKGRVSQVFNKDTLPTAAKSAKRIAFGDTYKDKVARSVVGAGTIGAAAVGRDSAKKQNFDAQVKQASEKSHTLRNTLGGAAVGAGAALATTHHFAPGKATLVEGMIGAGVGAVAGSLLGGHKKQNFDAQVKQASEKSHTLRNTLGGAAVGAGAALATTHHFAPGKATLVEGMIGAGVGAVAGSLLGGHKKKASFIEAIDAEFTKEAANAFAKNIMALAKKEGSAGGRGFALRQASNLPASAAKSPALQEALRAPSPRTVTGNPSVNREIAGIRDIGAAGRLNTAMSRSTGMKAPGATGVPAKLENDKHFGVLDTARAINKI